MLEASVWRCQARLDGCLAAQPARNANKLRPPTDRPNEHRIGGQRSGAQSHLGLSPHAVSDGRTDGRLEVPFCNRIGPVVVIDQHHKSKANSLGKNAWDQ